MPSVTKFGRLLSIWKVSNLIVGRKESAGRIMEVNDAKSQQSRRSFGVSRI